MANLFWGAVFIFLNINLNLGHSQIGLLPEFVGYILLINWVKRIRKEEECIGTRLDAAKGWLTFLAVVSGIEYCLALLGISLQMSWISIILMPVLMGISCLICSALL